MNTLLLCHFCIQIITDHFLLSKVSPHTRNKCTLIIPYLMPLEVFYLTQIIILPCMYFWLFPWQPTLCSILPLFLYLGGFYRKWISLVWWDLINICDGWHLWWLLTFVMVIDICDGNTLLVTSKYTMAAKLWQVEYIHYVNKTIK